MGQGFPSLELKAYDCDSACSDVGVWAAGSLSSLKSRKEDVSLGFSVRRLLPCPHVPSKNPMEPNLTRFSASFWNPCGAFRNANAFTLDSKVSEIASCFPEVGHVGAIVLAKAGQDTLMSFCSKRRQPIYQNRTRSALWTPTGPLSHTGSRPRSSETAAPSPEHPESILGTVKKQ